MIPHSKPTIGNQDISLLVTKLKGLQLAQGVTAKNFTEALTNYLGVRGGVLTNSGSVAQMALLLALGIGEGDEVIIPTYVCKSVYEAIVAVKATPVLCDIDKNWLMTYETVIAKMTPKTAAIILVHIFGFDAWDDRFSVLNVPVIEDFCQAFGLYSKRIVKVHGIASFYSFNATKCLTTGEGGFAATHDQKLLDKLEVITSKGLFKSKFTDLQAVLGLSQLDQYSNFLHKREYIANRYLQELSPFCLSDELKKLIPNAVLFRFPITLSPKLIASFISHMQEGGVLVRKGVDTLLHKVYKVSNDSFFETADFVFSKTICLPIYPSLTDDEQSIIIYRINTFL